MRVSFALLIAAFATPLFAQTSSQTAEAEPNATAGTMVVVVGAGGTDEYANTFSGWADQWKSAAEAADIEFLEIGRKDDKEKDRDELQSAMKQHRIGETPLWLVMLGHGTYDRKVAKFNLRGPDVSADELKDWLSECERPLIAIHGFSCSGAFLQPLQGKNRVIITATKSGAELNYSRFGGFMAESLSDMDADLDHDEQVSLLEAFLLASSKVARFYESEARLATEHSLLEDNFDGKGTSGDFFVGIRAESKAKDGASTDGRLAHRYIVIPSKNAPQLSPEELKERDRLEAEIEALREKKRSMTEDSYYEQLEPLMLELARLYQAT